MSETYDVEQMRRDIDRRLLDVIGQHDPTSLPTGKWVVLVEVVDADTSQRALWALVPTGQTVWDTLGMVDYAQRMEGAGINARFGDDES